VDEISTRRANPGQGRAAASKPKKAGAAETTIEHPVDPPAPGLDPSGEHVPNAAADQASDHLGTPGAEVIGGLVSGSIRDVLARWVEPRRRTTLPRVRSPRRNLVHLRIALATS